LSEAFAEHAIATESQIERLECVFGLLEKPARGKKCAAIEGLIAEAIVLMKEVESDVVRDAGLLAAAQAVEHYEISRYGTLKAWAEKLELKEVVELLDVTLEEEKATDQKFSVLAKDEISLRAEDQERPRAKSRAR
jgi:ferritin-like metal-binding protein YciE